MAQALCQEFAATPIFCKQKVHMEVNAQVRMLSLCPCSHLILDVLAGWRAGVVQHDHEGAPVAVAVGQLVHETKGLQVELLHAAALVVPQVPGARSAAEEAGACWSACVAAAPVAAWRCVVQCVRMRVSVQSRMGLQGRQ